MAEAGFFPGIILYLTYWYPAPRRAKMVALFMTAVPISSIIGGPLSGWIMAACSGVYGWAGWQWLFLLEAIPTVILGMLVWRYLPEGITAASWLFPEEKHRLATAISEEAQHKVDIPLRQLLRHPRVLQMIAIYFCFVMGLYGVSFWLPSLIKASGVDDPLHIGLLSAIPWMVAALGMVPVARHADARNERRWHLITVGALGALGLFLSVQYGHNTILALAALSLATWGIISTYPIFWSLPTALLSGSAAAAGIALINSLGNLAGFVSPALVGWLKVLTQRTDVGMSVLAGFMLLGCVLVWALPREKEDAMMHCAQD